MAHAASGKRSVLLVFGFFVVALLMSLHSPVWAQAATSWSYYRSNAIGMALEPLYPDSGENGRRGEAVRPDEPAGADGEEMFGAGKGEKWVLKRRSTGPGEFEEILLEDGERYSRTLRKRRGARVTELEYRSGQKVRETVFEEGRPVYEWELDEPGTEGEVTERSYRWDGEELLSVDETGGDGEAERVYLNGGDGMLGQVRRNGRVSNYAQGEEGRIRSEWHRRNGTVEIVWYGEGERYIFESYRGGELARRRTSSFDGDRQILEIRNVRTGETTTEIYNEDGRIAERVVRSGGSFRRELFKYDGELIEEKRIRSANVDRLFRYRYGEEEELNLVEIYERGELSKQIRYLSGDRRVETVFRKGEAIYRTEYRGEEMLSREQVE